MTRKATATSDRNLDPQPKPRQLAREARGLMFVYALFALVCGALAFQCVERPDPGAPASTVAPPAK